MTAFFEIWVVATDGLPISVMEMIVGGLASLPNHGDISSAAAGQIIKTSNNATRPIFISDPGKNTALPVNLGPNGLKRVNWLA